MRSIALALVVLTMVAACSVDEEALAGLRSCGDLEIGDEFGNTREVEGADVVLFSRPGRYLPEEAAFLTGLSGEVTHVSRTVGPCGQQDLFLAFEDGQWCVAVIGRGWDGDVCWEDLSPPAAVRVPVGDLNGNVLVAWAPGIDRSHVMLRTGTGISVASFIRDGVALVTLPDGISALEVVTYDGSAERVLP